MRRFGFFSLMTATVLALGALVSPGSPAQGGILTGNSVVLVDDGGPPTHFGTGDFSSLRLDDARRPVVSYYATHGGALRVLHCGNTTCTSGNSVEVVQDDGTAQPAPGYFTSLALDGDGFPVVSHGDGLGEKMYVVHCNDANCAGGDESIETFDTDGGKATSLELDADGYPVIAYQDHESPGNDSVKLLHCDDEDCVPSGDTIETIDSSAIIGYPVSLELDGAFNPVIAYYDQTNGDLKVAHCDDANCSGGGESISTPDSAGDVGSYLSMELDAAGNPAISYYDETNGTLKLLRCDDANCEGTEAPLTLDGGGGLEVGEHTSIALDGDIPVIAYQDETNEDLKLLRCGDAACTTSSKQVLNRGGETGYHTAIEIDSWGYLAIAFCRLDGPTCQDLMVMRCAGTMCFGDKDADGCPDIREQEAFAGTELIGGRRSHGNQYDYFNPTHDGVNRIDDILAVVGQYFEDQFLPPPAPPFTINPDYNFDTDRRDDPMSDEPWDLLGPDQIQRIDDILAIVKQYFHDCS